MAENNNEIDIISDFLSKVSDRENIVNSNLNINGVNVIDFILNANIPKDQKADFIGDCLLLDIDRGQLNEERIAGILNIGYSETSKSVLYKYNDDEVFKSDVRKVLASDLIDRDVFISTIKIMRDDISTHSEDMIFYIANKNDFIADKDNDKMFVMLLMLNKNVLEENKNDIVETLAKKSNPKLFKMLISSKLNAASLNDNNENLLFFIDGENAESISNKVKISLEAGVDQNHLNNDGLTAYEKNKKIAPVKIEFKKSKVKKNQMSM